MSEMVEKVARAQYECWLMEHSIAQPWEETTGAERTFWIDLARVAIEAMREPSEDMKYAALAADVPDAVGLVEAKEVWQAMIDAALAGGEGAKA